MKFILSSGVSIGSWLIAFIFSISSCSTKCPVILLVLEPVQVFPPGAIPCCLCDSLMSMRIEMKLALPKRKQCQSAIDLMSVC